MLALHEGVAVCMADAYARITRRPAFVEVHIAPGLGNALGMMHNARIGKTPLVVYAGQSPSNVLLQEPHLSGPLVDMARPIAKWSAQVEHAHDVPRALRRAFKIAAEPPQGPAFLALPMDVLDADAEMDIAPTTYTHLLPRPDGAGLRELAELIRQRQTGASAQAALERRAAAEAHVARVTERYWANARKNWDSSPISGPRLMHELNQALPENGLVFAEGVTNTKHIEMAIAPATPARLVKVRGGGIGPGLPGSLGAALARPDRKVVSVCSYGAAM